MDKWINVKDALPIDLQEVIITWVNHDPEPYYQHIKDVPMSGAGVYYAGKWYWYSSTTQDVLSEYGYDFNDAIDPDVEVTHWMALPEPPQEDT